MKRNLWVSMLLIILIFGLLPEGNVAAAGKKEQKITAENVTVTVGTKQKALNVKPKTSLAYKSLNKKNVSVDGKGNIAAKKVGQAKIIIKAQEGRKYRETQKVIKVTKFSSISDINVLKNIFLF